MPDTLPAHADAPHRTAAPRMLAFVNRFRWPLLAALTTWHALAVNLWWRPGPDSAVYLTLARQLRATGSIATPLQWEHDVNVLYVRWLGFLGEHAAWWSLLLAPLVTAWMLLAVYRTVRLVTADQPLATGRAVATLITLGTGLSAELLRVSVDVLPDHLFAAGLWTAMWGVAGVTTCAPTPHARGGESASCRAGVTPPPATTRAAASQPRAWWASVCLIAVGFAVMLATRSVVLVVLVAAAAALLHHALRRRRFGLLALAAGVLALGVTIALAIPVVRDDVLQLARTVAAEGSGRVLTNAWRLFTVDLGEGVLGVDPSPFVGPFIAGFAVVAGLSWWRDRPWWAWLTLAFLVQWLCFLPGVRYVVPLLPVLVWGGWRVLVWLNAALGEPRGGWLLYGVVGAFVVGNVVGGGPIVYEQRFEAGVTRYDGGKYAPVYAVSSYLREHAEPDAWLMTDRRVQPEVAWWSGRWGTAWLNDHAVGAPALYTLTPMDPALADAVERFEWALEGPVFEAADPRGGEPWRLWRVLR